MSAAASLPFATKDTAESVTLLELVTTVGEITSDDQEVVATVLHLLRSGRVVLRGTFRDHPQDI